jgi:hypothetical protein
MFDLYNLDNPTFACICGCKMFVITVMWDEESREVSWYDLRQECKECGAISTAPTPIDGMEDGTQEV